MRTLERLLEDQARLLSDWRRSKQAVAPGSRQYGAGPIGTTVRFGRVDTVVLSDPTYGPHLMVESRLAVGTPPQWQAASGPTVRCHVAPGWDINDYSPDQDVKMFFLEGIVVAEPVRESSGS